MTKKILLKAPVLTRSGYGEQARFALRALRSRPDDFEIFIQPIAWGTTSWITDNTDERRWIDLTIEKTIAFLQQGGQLDMSLQVSIPNEWENLAPVNIGYTAGIETTRVAHEWIQKNNMMDRIITISNHSKHVFETSLYEAVNNQTGETSALQHETPISVVNYPVRTYENLPDLDLQLSTEFNFVIMSQFAIRKNLPNTIKWFIEEFKNDDVGLIVKTNLAKNCLMDREHCFNKIKSLIASTEQDRKCKVYLLHGDMTDEEIHALYCHPKVNAKLSLPHGEGFGLPLFEAAYSGLPVVATGWSGQLDYLYDENRKERFYNVNFDMQPVQKEAVWDGVIMAESMWAYAREASAKKNMRQCYNDVINNEGFAADACNYAEELKQRFSKENMYAQFCDAIYAPTKEELEWEQELSSIELV
jgi:glycosyltransferase involved in cell wall biosynthesis